MDPTSSSAVPLGKQFRKEVRREGIGEATAKDIRIEGFYPGEGYPVKLILRFEGETSTRFEGCPDVKTAPIAVVELTKIHIKFRSKHFTFIGLNPYPSRCKTILINGYDDIISDFKILVKVFSSLPNFKL